LDATTAPRVQGARRSAAGGALGFDGGSSSAIPAARFTAGLFSIVRKFRDYRDLIQQRRMKLRKDLRDQGAD